MARSWFLIWLLALAGLAPAVYAQSGTSSAISGTVLDPAGAAIPGALVEAMEVNTRATRAVQTDGAGHYLFSQVNPGTYQLSVSVSGFAKAMSGPATVPLGRNVAVSFTLKIGAATQTVEVTAQQALLAWTIRTPRRRSRRRPSRRCPMPART